MRKLLAALVLFPCVLQAAQLSCNKDKEQLIADAKALSAEGKHRDAFLKIADCRFQSSDPRYTELAGQFRTLEARAALQALPQERRKERLENIRILKANDPAWSTFKPELDRLEKQESAERQQAMAVAAEEAKKERHGPQQQMPKKAPQIGMSKGEVYGGTWGMPADVRRTTTAGQVTEQWVYDQRRYLYFTNGVLTAIQD